MIEVEEPDVRGPRKGEELHVLLHDAPMTLLQGSEDHLFPVDDAALGAEGVEADFGRVLGEPRIGLGCLQEMVFEVFLNVFQRSSPG